MRYLPEIPPAGLIVIEPDELAAIDAELAAGELVALLALAELGQLLRARELGIRGDPLDLVR